EQFVGRVDDPQMLADAGDREQAAHLRRAGRYGEPLSPLAGALMSREDHPQPGRVDELKRFQIEHDHRRITDVGVLELAVEQVRAGEVQLAVKGQYRPVLLEADIHPKVLLSRHRRILAYGLRCSRACRGAESAFPQRDRLARMQVYAHRAAGFGRADLHQVTDLIYQPQTATGRSIRRGTAKSGQGILDPADV